MNRLKRASAFVALTISAVGLSVMGVRASTECERYIRVVRERVRPHKHSAETIARWVEWNKAHPNYKPRKQMTPEETWEKVSFACEVPLIQKQPKLELPTLATPDLDLPPELAPPETPTVVVAEEKPPVFETEPPTSELLVPPAFLPEVPTLYATVPSSVSPVPPVAATPEPGSLWLLGSSALGLGVIVLRRRRQKNLRVAA